MWLCNKEADEQSACMTNALTHVGRQHNNTPGTVYLHCHMLGKDSYILLHQLWFENANSSSSNVLLSYNLFQTGVHFSYTYKSSSLIVMEVDLGLDVSCLFSWVEERLGEVDTEVQIVGTPSPLPPASAPSSLWWVQIADLGALAAQTEAWPVSAGSAVARGIAATSHQLPHAASPGHAVRHTSRWDGVGKRRLAEPWQT